MSPQSQDFKGEYRKGPKTSIVRSPDGKVAPPSKYADLAKLIASLVPDQTMRKKYKSIIVNAGDKAAAKRAPNTRVREEKRNVQVDCWLFAARLESDMDYHTLIGGSPTASGPFLNSEVSGLPPSGKDRPILVSVRKQLASIAGRPPIDNKKYRTFRPPRKIRVTGSLFFDGDHQPGKIGPIGMKPKTVWEIHPVTSIQKR